MTITTDSYSTTTTTYQHHLFLLLWLYSLGDPCFHEVIGTEQWVSSGIDGDAVQVQTQSSW